MQQRTLTAAAVCLATTSLLGLGRTGAQTPARQPATEPGLLLIASMGEATLQVVDESTWQTVATLPTGPRPHEVRVAPDGQHAYVVSGRTITAIDLRGLSVRKTFDLGEFSAHDVRVSRDGRRLWAACAARRAVLELDTQTGEILQQYGTSQEGAWFVEVTPDESQLVTPNLEGKSVSVITRGSREVKVLPVGHAAYGIDVTPDGRQMWVSGTHLDVIDVRTARILRTIATPQPDTGRIRITPDGARVVVAMERSVLVLDAAKGDVVQEIPLSDTPKVLTISGDGSRAYVSNPEVHTATVVDLVTGRVLRTLATGQRPDGVAWAPRLARPGAN